MPNKRASLVYIRRQKWTRKKHTKGWSKNVAKLPNGQNGGAYEIKGGEWRKGKGDGQNGEEENGPRGNAQITYEYCTFIVQMFGAAGFCSIFFLLMRNWRSFLKEMAGIAANAMLSSPTTMRFMPNSMRNPDANDRDDCNASFTRTEIQPRN